MNFALESALVKFLMIISQKEVYISRNNSIYNLLECNINEGGCEKYMC